MLLPLMLLLAASDPKVPQVGFAQGVVAAAFSAQRGVNVITKEDVRRALSVEADKQLVGCASDSSCLSEIAAALGARIVVSGAVYSIDDGYLVELNVFDAQTASSVIRESSRAVRGSNLVDVVEERAWRLAAATRARFGDEDLRVLVLDVEASSATAPPQGVPALWVGAGGLGAAALAAFVVGAICDGLSVSGQLKTNENISLPADKARSDYENSNQLALAAVIGYGSGAILLAGATTAFVIGGSE